MCCPGLKLSTWPAIGHQRVCWAKASQREADECCDVPLSRNILARLRYCDIMKSTLLVNARAMVWNLFPGSVRELCVVMQRACTALVWYHSRPSLAEPSGLDPEPLRDHAIGRVTRTLGCLPGRWDAGLLPDFENQYKIGIINKELKKIPSL